MVGVGKGAEAGILIRGGEVLERAKSLTTVVFDKAGTRTRGEPNVTDIVPLGGSTKAKCCGSRRRWRRARSIRWARPSGASWGGGCGPYSGRGNHDPRDDPARARPPSGAQRMSARLTHERLVA
jgi:hypothetical protein